MTIPLIGIRKKLTIGSPTDQFFKSRQRVHLYECAVYKTIVEQMFKKINRIIFLNGKSEFFQFFSRSPNDKQ